MAGEQEEAEVQGIGQKGVEMDKLSIVAENSFKNDMSEEKIAEDAVLSAQAAYIAGFKRGVQKAEMTYKPDGYWARVCDIQKRQTEKGVSKYGQRLEENRSLSEAERLTYLEEELVDALMYIEHIKQVAMDREGDMERKLFDLKGRE